MRKVCWFLIVVLLLGCFAGCHQEPVEGPERSIENEDGTLSDWMKEEIESAFYKKSGPNAYFGEWWDPEDPLDILPTMYYGTYNGYVMFGNDVGLPMTMEKVIAGYTFSFANQHKFHAYKDGEFYDLEELLEQGLIDEEAIRIAHEHYTQIVETRIEYRKQLEESGG